MNHEKIKSTLFEALRSAGKLVCESLLSKPVIKKKAAINLVTEIDHASEKLILDIIQRDFPDHEILAEESLGRGSSPYRWIIDPIDGTTNFAHTYPVACISIGFESHGEMTVGGVYDPFRNELFFAEKGKGATLNGKPIHVSKSPALSESLLVTGFPYERVKKIDFYLAIFKDFLLRVRDIRRTGSAAIDLCYVASGRFDGYWETNLNAWDIAAGSLIAQEAGATLTDFSGEPFSVNKPQTLATNGLLHKEMLEVLKPHKDKV